MVWHATAFDFLRDFFFELTSLRCGNEDQALSAYAYAVTVSAMKKLLECASSSMSKHASALPGGALLMKTRFAEQYIRLSPWTDSLRKELLQGGQKHRDSAFPEIAVSLALELADKVIH